MESLDPVRLVEAWKLFTKDSPYAAAITLFLTGSIAAAILVNWVVVPLMKGIGAMRKRNGGNS